MNSKNLSIKCYLRFLLVFCLGSGCFAAGGATNSNATEVLGYLRQLGMMPTNAPAVDVPLSALEPSASASASGQSGPRMLSDFRGKWIFLNFWATWCGPCRQELPTVEGLFQDTPKDNFAVLGISIDQGPASEVKKFIQRYGITFPIFHDQQGQAASAYQAQSVPCVYLISPDWQVVGVLRGSRSWEDAASLEVFKKLVAIKNVGDLSAVIPAATAGGGTAVAGQSPDQVALPSDLAPPKMSVQWRDPQTQLVLTEFHRGQIVDLVVQVSWVGSAYRYAIKVPRVELPPEAGVTLGNVSSQSQLQQGQATLEYIYPLTFGKEGETKIGPISLAFTASGTQMAEQFTRYEPIVLQVLPSAGKKFGIILLIVGIVLTIGGIWWFILRKYRQKINKQWLVSDTYMQQQQEEQLQMIKAQYLELKKKALAGDRQGYSGGLLQLMQQCQQRGFPVVLPNISMAQLQEKVTYGGLTLSEQEIQYFEKQIINIYEKERA